MKFDLIESPSKHKQNDTLQFEQFIYNVHYLI